MASTRTTVAPPSDRVRLIVASSVMLTFISFWRAAAIVLNDLGSSAFYAGGIAEQAVGAAAPWFILGIMLFSFAVRAVYVESCSMFTRGGVYRVVKEALGGTFAKLSVSALMFDYILTGPISGVSAGQYITGLMNEMMTVANNSHWLPPALMEHGQPFQFDMNYTSAVFAAAVTIYYWWQNIKGIEESSDKALRVMQITTVMVVILFIWGALLGVGARRASAAAAHTVESEIQFGCTWLPQELRLADFRPVRNHHGLRTLDPGHERRGEPRPGQPRDPASEAQEPEARSDCHRDLQPDLHGRRHAAGFDADSGWAADADLSEQPDCRPGHVHGRPDVLARGIPHLCGVCRLPDSFRRNQHVDDRIDRRADARGGRWRADRLVPQTASEVRHQLIAS